jgi:hypothetical protein
MIGSDIINHLRERLSRYTDEFSTTISVSSLTSDGVTATVTTATDHGFATGQYIVIRGATNPLDITSITRDGKVVTVVCDSDHNLIDPSYYDDAAANDLTITIAGASPSEYNGTFKLQSVTNSTTFVFHITTTPTTPATTAGYLLEKDNGGISGANGYNGYKQITITGDNTFTYTTGISSALRTPSQGSIEVVTVSNISLSATEARAQQFYADRLGASWLFVVVGEFITAKEGTDASDISSAQLHNAIYRYETLQTINIYVYIDATGDILSANASEKACELRSALLRSLAGMQFNSALCDIENEPIYFVGDEEADYNTAYYVHRYEFKMKGYIQDADVVEPNPGVRLREVDIDNKTSDVNISIDF